VSRTYNIQFRESLKILQERSPDYMVNINSLARDLLEDPRELFLALSESKSGNDTKLDIILEDIYKTFNIKSYEFKLVKLIIDSIIIGTFKNISYEFRWTSYDNKRWFEILEIYLSNQSQFKDIKQ
jgi:hypothetical protein